MNRRVLVPTVVGVVALLIGGVFLAATLRGGTAVEDNASEPASAATTGPSPGAQPSTSPGPLAAPVRLTRVVSQPGHFSIGVPSGFTSVRHGDTVQLTSRDKTVAVTAGRGDRGSLRHGSDRFVRSLRAGYSRVRVLGRQPQHVHGRRALATYGHAVNARHVKVRFVSVVVQARPENYTVTTFAGFDTDPAVVLPQVNAVAGSFRVRR